MMQLCTHASAGTFDAFYSGTSVWLTATGHHHGGTARFDPVTVAVSYDFECDGTHNKGTTVSAGFTNPGGGEQVLIRWASGTTTITMQQPNGLLDLRTLPHDLHPVLLDASDRAFHLVSTASGVEVTTSDGHGALEILGVGRHRSLYLGWVRPPDGSAKAHARCAHPWADDGPYEVIVLHSAGEARLTSAGR